MDRVRLDSYLPGELGGQLVLCQALSVTSGELDLPCGAGEQAVEDGSLLRLYLSDARSIEVILEGAVPRPPGPLGHRRVLARFRGFLGDGEADLIAHLSSLRKSAHLKIVASEDVESLRTSAGWERWRLPHVALPERHADDVDLAASLFGKRLAAPLLVAGMTGGSSWAGEINRRLAAAAQQLGVAMGLGSQRAMLEDPRQAESFAVRGVAPDILLIANIGAAQLNLGATSERCLRLVEAVEADALAVHLNPLQEMVQPEGDRDWSALLPKIEALCTRLRSAGLPVLVKETGAGISAEVARRLRDVGVSAIDVGGSGGTAWGFIEGFRAADPQRRAIGATFRDWGLPTAEALIGVRDALGDDLPLIATGGLRSGLDAAKALALGADLAGMALPFFQAAEQGAEEVVALGTRIIEELRIAVFCAGIGSVGELRGLARVVPMAREG